MVLVGFHLSAGAGMLGNCGFAAGTPGGPMSPPAVQAHLWLPSCQALVTQLLSPAEPLTVSCDGLALGCPASVTLLQPHL